MSIDLAVKNAALPVPEYHADVRNSGTQAKRTAEDRAVLFKDASDVKRDIPPKELEKVASEIQIHLKRLNTELRLEVDSRSKKVVVKIIDPDNGQVIRQVPSEEMLEISKRMDEIIGVLFKTET